MKECPTCGNDGNWEVEMSQAITIEKLKAERDELQSEIMGHMQLRGKAEEDNTDLKAAAESLMDVNAKLITERNELQAERDRYAEQSKAYLDTVTALRNEIERYKAALDRIAKGYGIEAEVHELLNQSSEDEPKDG